MSVISGDAVCESRMRDAIDEALARAAAKPGVPGVTIGTWNYGAEEPELNVVVGGKPRVLEVSRRFLEIEPDSDALRKIAVAAAHLVEGDAPRVQLMRYGVYAAWKMSRERA